MQSAGELGDRRHAEEALRESEHRARAILDATTESLLMIDLDGKILAVNSTMARRLGKRPEDLLGQNARGFGPPDLVAVREARIWEAVRTGQPVRFEDERGGRWMDNNIYPVRDPQGKVTGVAVFAIDITERKRAEEALRRAHAELEQRVRERTAQLEASERKYRGLAENTDDILYLMDARGCVTYISPHVRQLGWIETEIVSRPFVDFIFAEDRNRAQAEFERVLSGGVTGVFEFRVLGCDGTPHWMEERGTMQRDEGGAVTGFTGMLRDVTTRKAQERALLAQQGRFRALVAELAVAEESARRRIAEGLHDDIGQTLVAAKLRVSALTWPMDAAELEAVRADVTECLDRVFATCRSLTFDLASPVLTRFGLSAALEELCERMQKEPGPRFTFRADGPFQPMKGAVEIILFHAVRELLWNAVKHARAQHVKVGLRCSAEHELEVVVEDDGVGLDPARLTEGFSSRGGFGLFTIRQRIQHLAGRMEILRATPHGTRVVMNVPLLPERRRRAAVPKRGGLPR